MTDRSHPLHTHRHHVVTGPPFRLHRTVPTRQKADELARALAAEGQSVQVLPVETVTISADRLLASGACHSGVYVLREFVDDGSEVTLQWDLDAYLWLERRLHGAAAWLVLQRIAPVVRAFQLPRYGCTGVDLSGLHLDEVQASRSHLPSVCFEGASLREANFSNACLTGAYLIGAELVDCVFAGAHLGSSALSRVRFEGGDLSEANLAGARLVGTYVSATVKHASFRGAVVVDGELDTILRNCDLRGATLSRTTVRGAIGCDFRGADLTDVMFAERAVECDFRGAKLTDVTFASDVDSCFWK
jgi:uncharacterized protein YjbI with pentapeptide repeats